MEEVDLNVALGLVDAPPNFKFRDSELNYEADSVIFEKDSINRDRVHIIDSDVGDHVNGNDNKAPRFKEESVKVETENLSDTNEPSSKQIKKEEAGDGEDAVADECEAEITSCAELEHKLSCGTKFDDMEKVYLLYCEYARFKGFSVRKGEQRYFGTRDGDIRCKEFICSCTGLANYRSVKHRLVVYKKLVIRSDCKARLIVAREDYGSFVVILFQKDHNHELVPSNQTYLLRSSRNLNYAKKSILAALNAVGIGVTKAFKFLEKESRGPQNVSFTKKDAFDHIARQRLQTRVEDGNAKLLFEYMTNKANADPFFFWKYQLDDDGRLLNILFREGCSMCCGL